jgi:hypothetical protein
LSNTKSLLLIISFLKILHAVRKGYPPVITGAELSTDLSWPLSWNEQVAFQPLLDSEAQLGTRVSPTTHNRRKEFCNIVIPAVSMGLLTQGGTLCSTYKGALARLHVEYPSYITQRYLTSLGLQLNKTYVTGTEQPHKG